ncbi:hypothetical protein AUC43_04325 [Hymenobacter sedentarius]|uniref:Uncharacterized protein n=1 Tax=Hymenobacter sedentarius TaxID=1411621 RepID=A0A0U4CM91_9BACT|nr:hypothetical protein AUC43_04325 [Hymenobacter sedentarius]
MAAARYLAAGVPVRYFAQAVLAVALGVVEGPGGVKVAEGAHGAAVPVLARRKGLFTLGVVVRAPAPFGQAVAVVTVRLPKAARPVVSRAGAQQYRADEQQKHLKTHE